MQNPCAKLCLNLVLSLICITELWWIGAYTRQSADIEPNSTALLTLLWSQRYILLMKQPPSQSWRVPGDLRQPGWHTALQPRCLGGAQTCSLDDIQPCNPTVWVAHCPAVWVTHSPETPLSGWYTALQSLQPGWHTALLAAILLLGWNSTMKKVAGGTGLPWKL